MVYERNIKEKVIFDRLEKTSYESVYDDEEKTIIADIFKGNRNIELYNGICVRLDSIFDNNESTIFRLSKIKFYDLICSNLLFNNYDAWYERVDAKGKELLERGIREYLDNGTPKSLDDLIAHKYFSNILAVSVMILDENGRSLTIERNDNVAISSGFISTSVTGSLDDDDFVSENPFVNCAVREIKEELGFDITEQQISIIKIVAGKQKLQPIILLDVCVGEDLNTIVKKIYSFTDFKLENKAIRIVEKSELGALIDKGNMTEAARAHLEHIVKNY